MNTQRIASMLATLIASLLVLGDAHAQKPRRAQSAAPKIAPDIANERNVLDLWKAKSDQPTPLVVLIHGGGFRGGSKESMSGSLFALRNKGISLMAINYRLSPEVTFPAHYMDSARAIQYARHHAKEWNIDPKRIGATGGSAGAGTSLWIGFHDDMADPVLREASHRRIKTSF